MASGRCTSVGTLHAEKVLQVAAQKQVIWIPAVVLDCRSEKPFSKEIYCNNEPSLNNISAQTVCLRNPRHSVFLRSGRHRFDSGTEERAPMPQLVLEALACVGCRH